MPLSKEQKQAIVEMLTAGRDRQSIAAAVGATVGQVSAVAAHVTMGTYSKASSEFRKLLPEGEQVPGAAIFTSQTKNRLPSDEKRTRDVPLDSIWLGVSERNEDVFWNPFPESGAANPHVLIFGESGFGKTYAVQCLVAELSIRGLPSIIFDYGQGFSPETVPAEFQSIARPVEIDAARSGVAINPLSIFPSDIHGPLNVAQRVADTFSQVYPRIGVQQHALLRDCILKVFRRHGIVDSDPSSWRRRLPTFSAVHKVLEELANDVSFPNRSTAAKVASHISTVFVFNTFRSSGCALEWSKMLQATNGCFVIRLKGLETSLERLVTEFLLWNLIGFIESHGPQPLQCFVVLDEAHRLSFDSKSPAERILREGRKFGIGLILASQQPQDFSETAFSNTATKLIFQTVDPNSKISRFIAMKANIEGDARDLSTLISSLPRGKSLVLSQNQHAIVTIASFSDRIGRPRTSNQK